MRQLFGPVLSKIRATIWRPAIRPYIVYALFMAIVFFGIARLDARFFKDINVHWHLVLFILLASTLGVLFIAFALPKYFPNLKTGVKTWLIVGSNLWGMLFFAIASSQIRWRDSSMLYLYIFLPALLSFSLPWLFLCAVRAIAAIPALRYLPLVVEHLRDVMGGIRWMENREMGIKWVFEEGFFEVSGNGNYSFHTYTPYKVETDFTVEYLFRSLLSLHNHTLNQSRPILFEAEKGLHGWEFHTPRRWQFLGRHRALDPNKTLKENGLAFRKITGEERRKSKENLSPRFRVATICITRSMPPAVPIPEPGLWLVGEKS